MKLKTIALFASAATLVASAALAGDTLLCHFPPGNPDNAHEIEVDDSAVPAHMAHGDTLGSCAGGGPGGAMTTLAVDAARTYCTTDHLDTVTDGISLHDGGPGYQNDNGASVPTNELVWEVIGSLGDADEGQGYCGSLSLGGFFPIGPIYGATNIQDCVAVVRFDVPADLDEVKGASLNVSGVNTNLGVYNQIAVSPCTYDSPGNIADGEGDPADPDCIVSGDDFAGASFVGIHDIVGRKADNNAGVVGGVSDINFLDINIDRSINLSYEAVSAINAARGSTVSFVIRCADSNGHANNFIGSFDNAIVLHDPAGLGFPGSFGSVSLGLSH